MAGEIDGLPRTTFQIEAAHFDCCFEISLGDSVRPDPRPSGNKFLPGLASGRLNEEAAYLRSRIVLAVDMACTILGEEQMNSHGEHVATNGEEPSPT